MKFAYFKIYGKEKYEITFDLKRPKMSEIQRAVADFTADWEATFGKVFIVEL